MVHAGAQNLAALQQQIAQQPPSIASGNFTHTHTHKHTNTHAHTCHVMLFIYGFIQLTHPLCQKQRHELCCALCFVYSIVKSMYRAAFITSRWCHRFVSFQSLTLSEDHDGCIQNVGCWIVLLVIDLRSIRVKQRSIRIGIEATIRPFRGFCSSFSLFFSLVCFVLLSFH